MSLVVAQISPHHVEFTGDSRFTDPVAKTISDLFSGGLKIVILNDRLCIAYAGTVKYGEEAIREASKTDDINQITKILLGASKQDEHDESQCEFLLGISNAGHRKLLKIKNGTKQEYANGVTWIGDVGAYSKYQECFHNYPQPEPNSLLPEYILAMIRLRDCMKSVIKSDDVPNVGDTQITSNDTGKGFMYMLSFESTTHGAVLPPGGGPIPFTLGPGKDSLLIELKTLEKSGIGAVGIYVHEARLGAIYAPLLIRKAIKVTADNPEEFRLAVYNRLGIKLVGGGAGLQPPDRSKLKIDDPCNCESGLIYAQCHYEFDIAKDNNLGSKMLSLVH